MSMDPVSLDVALLKLRFPDLILRPGMQVVVRVASRGEGPRGAIVLAGQLMNASLPEQVQTGDTLRLTVTETSPERVVLRMDSAAAALAAQTPPPAAGGLVARELRPDDEDGDSGRPGQDERARVCLVYETPALGRLDLRLEQGPEGVVVVVGTPVFSMQLAREHAEELRAALEARTQAPASVRIDLRKDPFDAYA